MIINSIVAIHVLLKGDPSLHVWDSSLQSAIWSYI